MFWVPAWTLGLFVWILRPVWVSSQPQWGILFPHPQKHVHYVNHQCPWPWHWLTSGSGPICADTGEMQRSYFTNNIDRSYFVFVDSCLGLFSSSLSSSDNARVSSPLLLLHFILFTAVSLCLVFDFIPFFPCAPRPDTQLWPLSFFSAFWFISLLDIWSRVRNNVTSVTEGVLETVGWQELLGLYERWTVLLLVLLVYWTLSL